MRLREEPSVESTIVATLPKGTVVQMTGPPWERETADGYVWRAVIVGSTPEDALAGWVATVGPGTFLTLEPAECPAGPVDLQAVMGMTPFARLSCLGDDELELEGTVVTGFGGFAPGTFEPAWLAAPFGFAGAIGGTGSCCFFYHQPPGAEPVTAIDGDRLRLTGHFSDPAADGCRIATGEPPIPERDELARVHCRELFVATSVERVGP